MNFENVGNQIAVVVNKKGKIIKTLSITDKPEKATNSYPEMELNNEYRFQQIPNKEKERDVLYVAGQSGSGKSHYILKYAEQYHRMFPTNDIYLFSTLSSDSTLDKANCCVKKVLLNNNFLNEDFSIDDFAHSLLIFDDVDTISNTKMKNKVYEILNMVLETGRHSKTSVAYSSHLACKGNESKRILNECHSVTIFCKTMGSRSLKYLLDNYFGLDKNEVKKIKSLPSRAVTILRSYPTVILSEKSAYVLN
jgi:hypothetical protein